MVFSFVLLGGHNVGAALVQPPTAFAAFNREESKMQKLMHSFLAISGHSLRCRFLKVCRFKNLFNVKVVSLLRGSDYKIKGAVKEGGVNTMLKSVKRLGSRSGHEPIKKF